MRKAKITFAFIVGFIAILSFAYLNVNAAEWISAKGKYVDVPDPGNPGGTMRVFQCPHSEGTINCRYPKPAPEE